MKIKVVYSGNIKCKDIINKMIQEDLLFKNNSEANASLKAFGGMIDKIVNEGDVQTIYIKPVDNLLLG